MRVFRSIDAAARSRVMDEGCLAIGNFDGVHVGHQALLRHALKQARARGKCAAALSFEPHPLQVLRPAAAPRLITSMDRRLELMAALGIDALIVQKFGLDYARTSAEGFVREQLCGALRVREVVVGSGFRVGSDRAGTERLGPMLTTQGASLHILDAVEADNARVSSTRIRNLIVQGHIEAANRLLDRAYEVDGYLLQESEDGRRAPATIVTDALIPFSGRYSVRVLSGMSGPNSRLSCEVGTLIGAKVGPEIKTDASGSQIGATRWGNAIRLSFHSALEDTVAPFQTECFVELRGLKRVLEVQHECVGEAFTKLPQLARGGDAAG